LIILEYENLELELNLPIEFNGEPKYGEHDITIIVRYKDSVRDEIFLTHDTTIFVDKLSNDNDNSPNFSMIIIPIILVLGVGIYMMRRRKKTAIEASD
jgi:ATP-dependent Zn protease